MAAQKTWLIAAAAASVIGLYHTAEGSSATWSAAPATSNWTGPNWLGGSGAGGAAAQGDSLVFGASSITALNNDFAAGTSFAGLAFGPGASAFTLSGNDIALTGPLAVNSGSGTQTINFNIAGSATSGISMSSAASTTGNNLVLNGNVSVGTLVSSGQNVTALPSNTLTIASGKTLTVANGLVVGSIGSLDASRAQLAIAGGGTLIVGNGAGTMQISEQGNASSTSITALLDLSNLANFQFNGGATGLIQLGINNRGFGNINLANTGNLITAGSLNVGSSGTSNGGTCTVSFGAGTNTLNIDNINIAIGKGGGAINFSNGTLGTLTVRGSAGTDASRANITVGIKSLAGTPVSGSGLALGTHTVDMKLNTLTIENASLASGSLNATTATISFGAGTIDVNNISMAVKQGAAAGTLNGAVSGTFNMSGGNLVVNNTFSMANAANNPGNLFAGFNLTGGTATISSDITQTGGNAPNINLTLDGGTLNMGGGGVAHNIGSSTGSITFNANSGTLTNVAQINGGLNGLNKGTAGTLFLVGTNSYTGDTNVNAGVLAVAGSLPSTGSINVNNNGTLVVTGTTNSAGSVNVNTGGVLAGHGNGTTTGVTGNVIMNAGGQIRPGPSAADNSVGTLAMSSLNVNGGDFRLDLGAGASDRITVQGAAIFNGSSTISPVFTGPAVAGTYTLLTASSLSGTAPTPNVPSNNTRTQYTVHFGDTVANAITLDVTGNAANLTWTGSVDAGGGTFVWDVKNTQNWTSSAPSDPNRFYDLDSATFDDSAVNRTVTINSVVSPTAVTVNNSTGHDYTFTGTGTIGSVSTFTKLGTGAATILTNNNYSGTTTVSGGTLIIGANQSTTGATLINSALQVGTGGSAGMLGVGSVTINSGGTLIFNRNDGPTIGNVISGSGSVVQAGTGSITLTATNTYTGATNINSGTVVVVGAAVSNGVPSTVGTPLGLPGVGSVNIPVGSTLELANNNLGTNNFGFGLKQFNVAGNGGGSGVILNNGTTQFNAFRNISLTGDATFGGSQRFDMRASTDTGFDGTLTLNNHTLHLNTSGNGALGLIGIDVSTGTISVEQGTLSFERATRALADPNSAIVMQPGTHLQFFQNTGTISQTRQVIINGSSIDVGEIAPSTFAFTSLQFLLKGDLNLRAFGNSTGTLDLLGNITQDSTPRQLTKNDANPLILAGSNSFTGGMNIQGGLVQLANANALSPSNPLQVNGTSTLQLSGNSITVPDLSGGSGVIENNNIAAVAFTVNNANDDNFGGVIQDGAAGGSLSLVKSGPGRLTLNSSNAYTGTTTVNGGTLTIGGGGNTGTLAGTTTITGTSSGTISFNRSDDISFTNPTSGAVNLSKEGGNVLTLPGTYSYTGTTAVNSGTLLVTGLLPSAGTVAVNDGGTLSGTGNGTTTGVVGRVVMTGNSHIAPGASSADGSVGTLTMASLTVNNGELRFDLGATSNDRINVTGAAVFNGGSISATGTPNAGTYTILTAGALTLNTAPTLNQPSDPNQRPAVYTLNTATANTLKLVVTGGPATLTWTGGAAGNAWDVHNTKNWTSSIGSDFFYNQDVVNFTDSSSNRSVTLTNDVAPGAIVFSHSTGSYTIGGSNKITGQGGLAITGGGTVVINTNNDYTGTTAISDGTLILGSSTAIPNNGNVVLGNSATGGALDLAGFEINLGGLSTSGTGNSVIGNSSTSNAAKIDFSNGSSTFGGIIQDSINGGTQPVSVQVNSGSLTFAGNNTYTGQTQVAGNAVLQIGNGGNTGSFGAGNINVDGTLAFNRSGTLILTTNIGGGGATNIMAGTVQLGNGGNSGQLSSGTIVNNGVLVLNRSDDFTINGTINGTGALIQNGTGTVTLSGTSSNFSGGLIVNGASLRVTGNSGGGTGTATLNGGTLVFSPVTPAAGFTGPLVLNGGTLGSSGTLTFPGDVTATAGSTSRVYTGDPQNGANDSDDIFTGALHGSGTILALATPNSSTTADAAGGVRFRGVSSDFNGVVVFGPKVKGELQTTVAGPAVFSPIGTGKIIMTGGTFTGSRGGNMSLLNLRDNSTGSIVFFGNDLSILGSGSLGFVTINPLDATAAGPLTTMLGKLTIGDQQILGVNKNNGTLASQLNTAGFTSVSLQGGTAFFSPATNGYGSTNGGLGNLTLGSISEAVPGSAINMIGLASLTLTGNNTYTGGTTVTSGVLTTSTNLSNGTLSLVGGTARIAAKAASNDPSGVTIVPAVGLTGGSLDLTNNAMVVDYIAGNSPFASIQSAIIAGYAGGLWNGVGITDSSAAAAFTSGHPTALGYAEASALGITSFAGHTVDNTSVLVRYTLSGDANLDGKVNALDFNAVATNFGVAGANLWNKGDFNYDGQVSTADFTLLGQNFNTPLAEPPLAQALGSLVPEPGTIGLLAMFGLAAARRRRRD